MPKPIIYAILALGAAAMLAGIFADGRVDASDLRIAGLAVAAGGLGLLVLRRIQPRSQCAAYELGKHDGYRDGYDSGRRVGRPVVVPLAKVPISAGNVGSCGSGAAGCCKTAPTAGRKGDEPLDSPEWSEDGNDSRKRSGPTRQPVTTL